MKEQIAKDQEKARILSEFKHDREKLAHPAGAPMHGDPDQGFEETKTIH